MIRVPVTSSNLVSLGWEEGVLEVEFRRGIVYRYEGVPEEVYRKLLFAESPGKEFESEVKRQFDGVRV